MTPATANFIDVSENKPTTKFHWSKLWSEKQFKWQNDSIEIGQQPFTVSGHCLQLRHISFHSLLIRRLCLRRATDSIFQPQQNYLPNGFSVRLFMFGSFDLSTARNKNQTIFLFRRKTVIHTHLNELAKVIHNWLWPEAGLTVSNDYGTSGRREKSTRNEQNEFFTCRF